MKNIIGIGNYIKSSNDTGGIVISQQLRDKVLAACIPTGNNDSPDRERVKYGFHNGSNSTVKIKIIPEYEGAVVLNTNVLLNSKVGTITSEKKFLDIYYDIDKQRPSDGELDKLIDYSLNNNDAKVIGVTLPNKDFPGEVVFGRGKYAVLNKELNLLDSTLVLDREYRNTDQFTPVISNINVGNSTGGSGLCIGGKVNDQINGDMFFHKLLLYPYSMHVDLLKRQLKKLKIENNF